MTSVKRTLVDLNRRSLTTPTDRIDEAMFMFCSLSDCHSGIERFTRLSEALRRGD